jgi:hypothetical protein
MAGSLIAIQVAVLFAILGYIIGIPWAIYRRVVDGHWPAS